MLSTSFLAHDTRGALRVCEMSNMLRGTAFQLLHAGNETQIGLTYAMPPCIPCCTGNEPWTPEIEGREAVREANHHDSKQRGGDCIEPDSAALV